MDVLAKLHSPDLARLRGRRTRLIRRWLAAGLLLAAALLLAHPGSARGAPATPTVVAAHDLPSGAALRASDVRLADLPDDARPAGVLSSPDAVEGRLLAGAVRAGEPLTDVRLATAIPASGDPGTATVPVRLADAAVAELLEPGRHVDVVAAPEPGVLASVLASGATVVTVGHQEPSAAKGRLVLLRLPEAIATRVAAISLERPVTVTLR
ncbi:SAF domain-containing protein [Amycolatopsis australiensis]|uniref:Flp pilus assembly protein CpaB n=1 Tax=Amycolatopsis australiensis TaxID=546364 RepID=A0A1K1QVT0_9PSEU|nr:SAF domain-containing protein [Amycolatopsis australiensis]SFW63777.1 Flp pilus assembly protein CpaB [Amycolatopsis australiensis]